MNLSRLFLIQLFKPFENRRFFNALKKPERYLYGMAPVKMKNILFPLILLLRSSLQAILLNYWPFLLVKNHPIKHCYPHRLFSIPTLKGAFYNSPLF